MEIRWEQYKNYMEPVWQQYWNNMETIWKQLSNVLCVCCVSPVAVYDLLSLTCGLSLSMGLAWKAGYTADYDVPLCECQSYE